MDQKNYAEGDFYFEVEDEETKLIKETPYELLKDIEKKQLGKNEEAKMTIYNALSRKEYKRVFMCKTAKEVWHTLIITHQGNSQVKNCKIDLLTQEYENKNHVRKFLRTLPLKWRAKVMTIEEAKDLATLLLDELIGNLTVYEMVLDNDGVDFKTTKEKVKSLSLKARAYQSRSSDPYSSPLSGQLHAHCQHSIAVPQSCESSRAGQEYGKHELDMCSISVMQCSELRSDRWDVHI
ncbi:hypothetical protein Tco_0018993 [Tanacetum coccineum]